MNQELVTILIGILIAAILVVAGYFSIKKKKQNEEDAEEFLRGLSNEIIGMITIIIGQFDPDIYDSAQDFEIDVLEKIYDITWDYVKNQVSEAYKDNAIVKAVFNILDKEYVLNFVRSIIETNDVKVSIMSAYAYPKISSGIYEEEDKKLSEEYSDQDQYVESSSVEDLEPAKEEVHTEEEIAAINPPTDNEEDYNVEDDSMEIITDKPIIVTATDKNGNTLYYEVDSNGKKKRVGKDYAKSLGVE